VLFKKVSFGLPPAIASRHRMRDCRVVVSSRAQAAVCRFANRLTGREGGVSS